MDLAHGRLFSGHMVMPNSKCIQAHGSKFDRCGTLWLDQGTYFRILLKCLTEIDMFTRKTYQSINQQSISERYLFMEHLTI